MGHTQFSIVDDSAEARNRLGRMSFQPMWRVVARGPLTAEAHDAIESAGITLISGHEIPGHQSSSFAVAAPRPEDAAFLVKRALEGHALFVVDDDVQPLG
jgi:hypothetical protein